MGKTDSRSDDRLEFESLELVGDARVGVDAGVRALFRAPADRVPGVAVSFYEGNADDDGSFRLFDQEYVPVVTAGGLYQPRVPFQPEACGPTEIFVAALEGTERKIVESEVLNVPCEIFLSGDTQKAEKLKPEKARNTIKLKAVFELEEEDAANLDLSDANFSIEQILLNGSTDLVGNFDWIGDVILIPKGKSNAQKAVFEGVNGDMKLRAHLKRKGGNALQLKLKLKRAELGQPVCAGGTTPIADLQTMVVITGAGTEPLVLSKLQPWECFTNGSGKVTKPKPL